MLLTYNGYVLTGTVDECLEFIRKTTPMTVSSNLEFTKNVEPTITVSIENPSKSSHIESIKKDAKNS